MDFPEFGIHARGEMDAHFLVQEEGQPPYFEIRDNKTAIMTDRQVGLKARYTAQLNSYADILENLRSIPVKKLSLVYHQLAKTALPALEDPSTGAYSVRFDPVVVPVERRPGTLRELVEKFHKLMSGPFPGFKGGEDAEGFLRLAAVYNEATSEECAP